MTSQISRRDAISGAAAAIGLASVPRIASAASYAVGASILPLNQVAPLMATDKRGFFAAENITFTPTMVTSGAVAIPGLIAGAYDISYSNVPSGFSAMARGIDLRILMECQHVPNKPPDSGALLGLKGDPNRTGKSLEGRTLGVNAIRDYQWAIIRSWIRLTGGNPEKVDFREVPLPQMIDAIKGKQIDTALVLDPFLTAGLNDPSLEVLAWPQSRVVPDVPASAYFITGQTAEQKAPMLRAFLRAYRKGVAWVNANLGNPSYMDLLASYSKVDPAVTAKMIFRPSPSYVNPAGFEKINKLMLENGLLTSSIDVPSKIFKG